jgi:hypothetical protein
MKMEREDASWAVVIQAYRHIQKLFVWSSFGITVLQVEEFS